MDVLEQIKERLTQVIDPETGMDVVRMKLVRELKVGEEGKVELTFRPSSVVCPLGFQLGITIKEAVQGIQGVRDVRVEVEHFVHAEQLKQLLESMD